MEESDREPWVVWATNSTMEEFDRQPWVVRVRALADKGRWADPDDAAAAEFYEAAKRGDLQKLEAAAATTPGLNLNALHGNHEDKGGETALYAAVRSGHKHIVDVLIRFGADLEVWCHDGYDTELTALHEAAGQANPDILRALLDAGADIQAKFQLTGDQDEGVATFLVLREVNPRRGRPIEQKHFDTIDLLLSRGIDINAPCSPSCPGDLLYWALKADSVDLVKSLIARGAEVRTKNEHGHKIDLLSTAVSQNATAATLEYLVGELGLKGSDGWALGSLATTPVPAEILLPTARILFDAARADPDRDANFPNTQALCGTLCAAAYYGYNPALVQFLLDNGMDVNSVNGAGKTPLLVACQSIDNADAGLVKLLLERGADICSRQAPFSRYGRRAGGNNALHCTAFQHPRRPDMVGLLLALGVDAEARNIRGESPLLTHAGVPWRNSSFNTLPNPLSGYVECFRLIATSCQNVNAVDRDGKSALHLLANEQAHIPAVKAVVGILLQKGADPNIRDNAGITAASCLLSNCGIQLDASPLLNGLTLSDQELDNHPDNQTRYILPLGGLAPNQGTRSES